ncbi:MAG: Crp/Fnr family transcriptional regulator [Vulcanibacillus sp.]
MGRLEEILADVLVFRKLTDSQLKLILEKAVKVTFKKGEVINLTGNRYPYAFILVKGLIYANKESAEGRNLTLRTFSVGDTFWGHAVFKDTPTPTTLVSFKPSEIYQWHRDDVMPILLENNGALWDLCSLLSQRTVEVNQTIEEIVFNPVVNRLARLLVGEFESDDDNSIRRNMTLDEMAAKIGSTREVVCRLLYRLSDQNLIQVDRTKFILINKIELGKLAEGDFGSKSNWD